MLVCAFSAIVFWALIHFGIIRPRYWMRKQLLSPAKSREDRLESFEVGGDIEKIGIGFPEHVSKTLGSRSNGSSTPKKEEGRGERLKAFCCFNGAIDPSRSPLHTNPFSGSEKSVAEENQ